MVLRSVPRVLAGLFVCLAVLCSTVVLAGCSSSTDTAAGSSTRDTATGASPAPTWVPGGMGTVAESALPAEARRTLALIDQGGPFPYAKDGVVFGNFERELPSHERGYYHEYTVPTPGSRDRGARRVVTGQGGEFYYTDDHYESFRAVLR